MSAGSRLAKKVALVTGGSRSIGRAIALGFAREGAAVAVNYRDDARDASEVVELAGQYGEAMAVRADTSNRGEVDRMIDGVVERFGRLDILVNNAGVLTRTPFLEITEEEWDRIVAVNLKGYFLCAQAAARVMVDQGSGVIINISSTNEEIPSPNLTHYASAKGGVRMLTRQLALELAPYGIRANAIAPGLIETDMNRSDIAEEAFRSRRLSRIPLKIIGTPEDIVGAAIFLASDESRLATGSTIFVDGGALIS